MKRKNRLCHSEEIKRVRQTGRSYTHPLLVLIKEENCLEYIRVSVIAGKNSGGAVDRNRVKRRIRACMDGLLPEIQGGWDLILQSRNGSQDASSKQFYEALTSLLIRADLIQKNG